MSGGENSSPNAERVEAIRERLQATFSPAELQVLDESHLHVGHPGARDGRGHFRVRIRSESLAGASRIEAHRAIYAALGELMTTDIHALAIEID